jgi:LuxR family transcriptional regulator, maltose regulon positive regulatory protein
LFVDGLDHLPQRERDALAGSLFDALPPQCRLVVASRAQLPHRFELMFNNGAAVRVTSRELRFDENEARSYLTNEMYASVGADALYLSEGWPAGLRQMHEFAATHRGQPLSREMLAEEMSRNSALNAYFSDVLRQQPEEVRSLVERLSILEEMTAELVDSLSDSPSATFSTLVHENLFIVAVNDHPHWYRFHRTFSAWLRHNRSTADGATTINRAVDWLFRNGHYQQAQRYVAGVGNADFLAKLLISSGGLSLVFRGGPVVTRILQSLPLAVVQSNPALELVRLYRLVQSGEITVARANFEDLKERTNGFAATGSNFAPTVADGVVMELLLSLYEDRTLGPQALINAEASLGTDQSDGAIRPSVIRELLSWSYYHAGNFQRARTSGRESVDLCLREGIPYVRIYAYLAIGLTELADGNADEAAGIYGLAEDEANRHFGAECNQVMAAQILGAEISLARNQLAEARDVTASWSEGVAHGDGWVDLHASLYRTLSSALRALGDSPAALAVLDKAKHMARERRLWRLEQILENHQLREACLGGNLELAGRIARTLQNEHPRSVSLHHQGWRVWFTRPPALARYALQLNDLTACAIALQDIDDQLRLGRGNHNLLHLERDILETRMLFERGDENYVRPLARALGHAAKARLLRPFLDDAPMMVVILTRYAEAMERPREIRAFLAELLGTVTSGQRGGMGGEMAGAPDPGSVPGTRETLSKREAEVLTLICEGLTSKEVARHLRISINTVLTYRKALYRKLCATTRSQLILAARERHISRLPPVAPR